MKIVTTRWGSCLPDQPYYPLYLANGVDGMFINILGSGDAWFEQCDYGAPLPLQRPPGWFKSDRRTHRDTGLVYGTLFPLFEFAACPFLNNDHAVPRHTTQYFDPRRATLTTFFDQRDNETLQWMRVKVTTFLTKDHVQVEHYEFLETPTSGAAIVFFLNSPSGPHLDLYKRPVKMDRASLRVEPGKSLMSYEYAIDDYRGGARSWCDCKVVDGSAVDKKKEVFVYGRMRTRMFHKGESFTRYLVAIDSDDAPNYRSALSKTLGECRRLGYRRVRDRHQREWLDYFSDSRVELPDPLTQFLYDFGRYMIRGDLHPSGFLPMGITPHLWQCCMFWDACFAIEAILGSGHVEEARRALRHLRAYMPRARADARKYKARGAHLQWTVEREKFTHYPFQVTQVHNNAMWANTILRFWRYTGDTRFLRGHIDIVEEFLLFLRDFILEERGDYCIVGKCEGVDESVSNEKTNDTWTCAVFLKALMEYREAARFLKRKPRLPDLDTIITKLQRGLDRNVDRRGVMQSFAGGRLPHWGSLIFDLFPEHPAHVPTLREMMKNYDPKIKLYNFHGVTRYAEKSFPWADFWAARCFARIGHPLGHKLLKNARKCANFFGGLPERVWYHGEHYNHYTITCSAALVWAVNGLLANVTGHTLRVLGSAAGAWRDVKFEGIYAGDGLVVSGIVRNGKLSKLMVRNLSRQTREVECRFGRRLLQRRRIEGGATTSMKP